MLFPDTVSQYIVMPKYAKETKEERIYRHLTKHDSMRKILEVTGIPKSTFYGWLNKHTASEIFPETREFTLKNFRILTQKIPVINKKEINIRLKCKT